jgi:hypothetical protein
MLSKLEEGDLRILVVCIRETTDIKLHQMGEREDILE